MKRMMLVSAAVVTGLLGVASAEPVPWSGAEVDLVARKRPVEELLRAVFKAEGLTMVMQTEVDDPVSGEFDDTAERVFKRIAGAYDLVPYYDGSVVYITASGDMGTAMYELAPETGEEVQDTLSDLALGDRANQTRMAADGTFLVSGTPGYRQAVDGVIRSRDTRAQEPADAIVTRVFELKYAWAQDTTRRFGTTEVTVPGVATIMRAVASGNGDGLSHGGAPKATFGARPVDDMGGPRPDRRDRRDPYGRGVEVSQTTFEPQISPLARPVQPLPGQMTIEADPRLNAIIIRDRAANMDGHAATIASLDVESKIVAIEATIVDVDTSRARELGVQWRLGGDRFSATQGGRVTRGLPLSPENFVNPFAGGLLGSGVIGGKDILSARFAALEAEGLAKIVSRPQVMTIENVEASFNNTRTFFARVQSDFDARLFEITTGTILSVTPDVVEEDGQTLVKLIASVEDGRQIGTSVDGLPQIDRSAVGTQGVMRIGETLLFGGLTVDRTESFEDRVPFLGKVPVLGGLFRQESRQSSRVERMFLLTPRLIDMGGNVAQRLEDAPAPIIGQAAREVFRPAPRPEPRPAPELREPPEEPYAPRALPREVNATTRAATSNGLAVTVGQEGDVLPVMRKGQLFTDDCDDLDPYAACEDDA